MTKLTKDEKALIPEPAPEQDVSSLPDNDPGTDGLDPDEQGGEH